MSEPKKQLDNVESRETRRFHYNNDENENLSFEFEIDVTTPETALAEISDFRDLLAQSFNDLELLAKEFAAKIEKKKKPEEKKEEPKKPGQNSRTTKEAKPVVKEDDGPVEVATPTASQ